MDGVLQGISGGGCNQRGNTSIQKEVLPIIPALHATCLQGDCRSQRDQSQVVIWSIALILFLGECGTCKE